MAAAAVAVGVGQAEAATVVNYDIELRYDGTFFGDVEIGFREWDVPNLEYDWMPLDGNPFGIVGRFSHLKIGDIVRFVAEVIHPDDPYDTDQWSGGSDNGGRANHCDLAGYDCSNLTMTFPGTDFQLYYWDTISTLGTTKVGEVFQQTFWGPEVRPQHTSSVSFYAWWENANFTVLSVNEPAPVPLPISIALMPIGLSALAMMRRRRRLG